MTKDEFDHVILSIIEAAEGDPTIMTGLPPVDLKNEQLRFTRALEICEKVEALKS